MQTQHDIVLIHMMQLHRRMRQRPFRSFHPDSSLPRIQVVVISNGAVAYSECRALRDQYPHACIHDKFCEPPEAAAPESPARRSSLRLQEQREPAELLKHRLHLEVDAEGVAEGAPWHQQSRRLQHKAEVHENFGFRSHVGGPRWQAHRH